ncbi:hypothetical protein CTAYLR_008215 [Chrysophaeum taylorii]|uniref:Mitochondrial carrier protein n=1 Tax=Chrysophaeum taylorii TaxID=2483200 RepID=A0AAD7UAL3_9STRA|nr:hypothetical protein CTAYLR_008215 [Chrysophaeum taylorii]
MKEAGDILETAVAGGFASLWAKVVCHPIDTVKARVQGALEVGSFVRREGIRGMYRGFGVVALIGTPAGMLYFTTYDLVRGESFWSQFVAGVFAEAVACLLFVPVDVAKEKAQLRQIDSSLSEGLRLPLRTLYRGYGATVLSFGVYSGLYFGLYEKLRDRGGISSLASAFAASGFAAAATSPLDLAKLRSQTATTTTLTFVEVLREVVLREGVRGLFRGTPARVAHLAPSTALALATFDFMNTKKS